MTQHIFVHEYHKNEREEQNFLNEYAKIGYKLVAVILVSQSANRYPFSAKYYFIGESNVPS